MIVIDRKAIWTDELAWLVAILAELGHERAAIIIITREYLHSIIHAINDEQETSMMVERQAESEEELAISIAFFLGADRELDSSITIKSIVSHLFHFNLSLSHTRQERHQASKQATSNKNQSMKEQRTAPPSLKPTTPSLTRASS